MNIILNYNLLNNTKVCHFLFFIFYFISYFFYFFLSFECWYLKVVIPSWVKIILAKILHAVIESLNCGALVVVLILNDVFILNWVLTNHGKKILLALYILNCLFNHYECTILILYISIFYSNLYYIIKNYKKVLIH